MKQLIAALLTIMSFSAFAEGFYLGGQYSYLDYDEDDVGTLNPSGLFFRTGLNLTDAFAIEGRLGFGLSDDSITLSGVEVDFELERLVGLYAKYNFIADSVVSPYLIGGFTHAKAEASASAGTVNISSDGSDNDISYGAGIDIRVAENSFINLEYMSLLDKKAYELNGLQLGFTYKL